MAARPATTRLGPAADTENAFLGDDVSSNHGNSGAQEGIAATASNRPQRTTAMESERRRDFAL